MAPIVLGIIAVVSFLGGFEPLGLLLAVASLWLAKDRFSRLERRLAAIEKRIQTLGESRSELDSKNSTADAAPGLAAAAAFAAEPAGPGPAPAALEAAPLDMAAPAPSLWATRGETPAGLAQPGPAASNVLGSVPAHLERGPLLGDGLTKRLLRAVGPSGTSAEAIETWLSGRLLAVVGGIALLLGAVFFLSLAFSRGWINEPLRVVIGLLAGSGLIGIAVWLFGKRFDVLGNVLIAVGLAIVSLALYAAAPLYGLIAIEVALVGALVAAIVAAGIAIRFDSQLVAGMGLVAVLAAPPVLGASPNLATVVFLSFALVGTTAVALFRSWRWLSPIAFVLSAPQLASYALGDAPAAPAVAVVLLYWALNAVAAGGEEWRVRRSTIAPSSVTLLLAATTFAIWAGFVVLDSDLVTWRGPFLVALAAGHAAAAALFLRRDGDRHPFGLIAAGTGVAAFSLAIPVHFGGPPVPIAWAAEAVALAWVASVRRHEYSAIASVILGTLSIGHLVLIEYPPSGIGSANTPELPFIGPNGATLAFLLAALAVAGVVLKARGGRTALAALAAGLITYALPFELSGVALVAAWSAIFTLSILAERFVVVPERADQPRRDVRATAAPASRLAALWADRPPSLGSRAIRSLRVPAAIALSAAVGHVMTREYPLRLGDEAWAHETPFYGLESLALFSVLAALTVVSAGWHDRAIRAVLIALATGLVAYVMPAEISGVALVGGWLALALLAYIAARLWLGIRLRVPAKWVALEIAEDLPLWVGMLTAVVAVGHVLAVELPPAGFFHGLAASTIPQDPPFIDVATLTATILAVAVVAAWSVSRDRGGIGITIVAVGGIVAYLLPFELVAWLAVAGWAGLALAGLVVAARWPAFRVPLGGAAVAVLGIGVSVLLVSLAPLERLIVDGIVTAVHPLLVSPASGAAAALIAAMLVGGRIHRSERFVRPALVVAGAIAIYALSVGLVDEFQGRVGGTTGLEELQKQASVGLTVLWAICGGLAFGAGQWQRLLVARYAGLALLGLATAKAFIVDLAGLDVAYRVLSFVGLGILLLVSAFVAQRMRPKGGSRGSKAT
jgi:hypothetical protein